MNPNPPKKSPAKRDQRTAGARKVQIRLRAYELYESHGREDGHDLDDWLRAETELTEKKVRSIAA